MPANHMEEHSLTGHSQKQTEIFGALPVSHTERAKKNTKKCEKFPIEIIYIYVND